jgi:hypothetical protein
MTVGCSDSKIHEKPIQEVASVVMEVVRNNAPQKVRNTDV